MSTPRFPARNTPEWYEYVERRLIDRRVDNDRQWQKLRSVAGGLAGLDPVQEIANVLFGSGSGSGTGSGSCALSNCIQLIIAGVGPVSGGNAHDCAQLNGTFVLNNGGSGTVWEYIFVDPSNHANDFSIVAQYVVSTNTWTIGSGFPSNILCHGTGCPCDGSFVITSRSADACGNTAYTIAISCVSC